MQSDRIRPRQCFYLRSGEVIRVNSVVMKQVHCDLFDMDTKRWQPLTRPMPTWTIYEPCADPSATNLTYGTLRRCWNAMCGASNRLSQNPSERRPSKN